MAGPARKISQTGYRDIGTQIREQILEYYRLDSCVATTRATIDVLKALHVDAYGLACTVMAVNKVMYDWASEKGRYPELEEMTPQMYGLGIVNDEDPDNGLAHVVAIAEREWLLDFSLDQISRPEYGIIVNEPVVVNVRERFLRGNEMLIVRHRESFLYYTAFPKNKAFQDSPNWEGESKPKVEVRVGVHKTAPQLPKNGKSHT